MTNALNDNSEGKDKAAEVIRKYKMVIHFQFLSSQALLSCIDSVGFPLY